jgi:hypothetical protein
MLKNLWHKALHRDKDPEAGQPRLPRPREIPQAVGQTLVVNHKQDPDWVWALMAVTRPSADSPDRSEFRVYSAQEAVHQGVTVRDWNSLDDHPELIQYFGWLDQRTREMELHRGAARLRRAV